MAAVDFFNEFLKSLTEKDQQVLADLITRTRADLLAARSEDARVRIVEFFIEEAHEGIRSSKR
jgi:hypothetical protein